MRRESAGLLMTRLLPDGPRVLVVHPGGPFHAKKDLGSWSIPKGELEPGEDPLVAAAREFAEETGQTAPDPVRRREAYADLGEIQQKGGKWVRCFAFAGTFDPARFRSNTFPLEWPPGSGTFRDFPEVDRADQCDLELARARLKEAQRVFLDRLVAVLGSPGHAAWIGAGG